MDWIHCNSCHIIATVSNSKIFHLTSCGHIYCNSCIKPDNSKKCLICGNNYTIIQLNADLKPEIKEYFKNPEDVLKRALEIIMFQGGHQKLMHSYFKNVSTKYMAAKQEINRLNELLKKQDKELKELRHHYSLLKQRLNKTAMQSSYNNLNIKGQSTIQSTPHSVRQTPLSSIMNSQTRISPSPYPNRQSQPVHWLTPKHLTLCKPTPPSSGSSGGNNSTVSISPMSTPNFLSAYRSMSQYSSASNTPMSKTGAEDSPVLTPEMSNFESLHSGVPKNRISGVSMQSTNRMLNKLNLGLHLSREK